MPRIWARSDQGRGLRGAVWLICSCPISGNRNFTHVLRHLVAALHRRPLGDGRVPALDVGILVHVDRLPLVARDPRPDRDVGDRVVTGDEFAAVEPAVEHAVQAMRLLEVTLLGVRRLALVVFHEVMDLSQHRAGAAHLPHQPFQHAVARLAVLRQKLAGLVREIDHQRRRLHQADAGVTVDDGRDTVVRAYLEEFRLELLVLADIDRMHGVGEADLLQHDGGLAAVGRRPRIEIDHGLFPVLATAGVVRRGRVHSDQIEMHSLPYICACPCRKTGVHFSGTCASD